MRFLSFIPYEIWNIHNPNFYSHEPAYVELVHMNFGRSLWENNYRYVNEMRTKGRTFSVQNKKGKPQSKGEEVETPSKSLPPSHNIYFLELFLEKGETHTHTYNATFPSYI